MPIIILRLHCTCVVKRVSIKVLNVVAIQMYVARCCHVMKGAGINVCDPVICQASALKQTDNPYTFIVTQRHNNVQSNMVCMHMKYFMYNMFESSKITS